MKIRTLFPFLLVVSLFLTGCEGAKYPLGDPNESSVEDQFIGSWIYESPDGDEESYLTLLEFNDHEYLGISWNAGDEDELMMMQVFSTMVDGTAFANIKVLGSDEDEAAYFFFKYERASDDELVVYAIDDDQYDELSELESAGAVRRFIEKRMADPEFFDDESVIYRKLEEWAWPWEDGYGHWGH